METLKPRKAWRPGTFALPRSASRRLFLVCWAFYGFLPGSRNVSGQTFRNWINDTNSGAYFDVDANWNPQGTPGPTDVLRFGLNSNYRVVWDQYTASQSPAVGSINVSSGQVRFENIDPSQQWRLDLLGTGSSLGVSGQSTRLTVYGIRLDSHGTASVSDMGELRIDGSHSMGSRVNVADWIGVNGVLDVRSGGVVTSASGLLGRSTLGHPGNAFVQGAGSRWTMTDRLTVGVLSNGNLTIADGGRVSNNEGIIANGAGTIANARVHGQGSQWVNQGMLTVGGLGNGLMEIQEGGYVSSQGGIVQDLFSTAGRVDVSGPGSRWDVNGTLLSRGQLSVRSGGRIVAEDIVLLEPLDKTTPFSTLVSGAGAQLSHSGVLEVETSLRIENGGMVVGSNGELTAYAITTRPQVNVDGPQSAWQLSGSLTVNGGQLRISNGGSVSNNSARIQSNYLDEVAELEVDGSGSNLHTFGNLRVGESGDGHLQVSNGGLVYNVSGFVGSATSDGIVTISGSGSRWQNLQDLNIGSSGIVSINTGTEVQVGRNLTIAAGGVLKLNDGALHFSATTTPDVQRIQAINGVMSGDVFNNVSTDVSTLNALRLGAVDSRAVTLVNSGTLSGSRLMGCGLINLPSGQIHVANGGLLSFAGNELINAGTIANQGGRFVVDGQMTVGSSGLVRGHGEFEAGNGWVHRGTLILENGTADVFGSFLNDEGALIRVQNNADAVFYDSFVHNGEEIFVEEGSSLWFQGSLSGTGTIGGSGTIFLGDELNPGNSPGLLTFTGDAVFAGDTLTRIELAGTGLNQFDRLVFGQDAVLAGSLLVDLIDGHLLGNDQHYLIADVGGTLTGQFLGLGEGDLVGQFGGRDLFITYRAGSGNDIALFTAIPEAGYSLLAMALVVAGSTFRRRIPKGNHTPDKTHSI